MTFEEIKTLKELGTAPFPIRSRSAFRDGYTNVNHRIAIRISEIASHYDTSADISIFNSTGDEIGVLCFTRELGPVNWRTLTESQFIAFLSEASFHDRENDFNFEYNYVILKDSFYVTYIHTYRNTAPIWGGFIHASESNLTSYKRVVPRIDLQEIILNNDLFKENSKRAVMQTFAHERFLKLYHLLELRFDVEIVQQIQSLDFSVYPERIGKILSDYSHTEFIRLKSIIDDNCQDINLLVSVLNQINNFPDIAIDLLYKFGKDSSNPLKDEQAFINVLPFGFDEASLRAQSINFQGNHPKFIRHLTAYWIYRVRCSIAHNKIGEYILSHNSEDFIVEFAEPLIKEVIRQSFKP